jgi:autotransporter strand-loop-strand O-heptosyltransferase
MKHYDFIEIGTSDFDTLIGESDDNVVGLSIEPIKYYLDRLPNRKNIKKLPIAVSDKDGFIEIYYIPDEKIIEHNLKWWVRGSNSIGKPHPFTVKEYGEEFYNSVVEIEKVPTLSWTTLVDREEIGSIGYLKIDTEGYDHVILNDYIEMCKKNPKLFANKIKFERHPNVSNIEEIDKVTRKFVDYSVEYTDTDVLLTKMKIPKIIHQTFRTKELPTAIQESVDKLKSMNPEYEYRFYDDDDCYEFIKENYDVETLELYSSINSSYGSAKADFFRYLVMYKVGGVYLDIKSCTTKPLSQTIIPTDEYLLSHWVGKDWSELLNYYHGEFQNWHIICRPNHPFLEKTIELVKENIINYRGQQGKKSVLKLTGPVVYSQAILSLLDKHKVYTVNSPVREFQTEFEINLIYRNTFFSQDMIYGKNCVEDEPIILSKNHKTRMDPNSVDFVKKEKSYVLYSTENYFDIVAECAKSIREFSNIPILVYLINSDKVIDVSNTRTIRWDCDIEDLSDKLYLKDEKNFYIDRKNPTIYKILIQRPLIIKDALSKYSQTVCYVDSDSIATPLVDTIFSFYKENSSHPYFVEGIYEYLKYDGRGGGGALGGGWSDTLEHNACMLFNVDQTVRKYYRQTGYFVAGQNTYDFLDEWYWMCNHPKILNNISNYAPYDEETIANVLLWKYNIQEGLPYIYVNGSVETVNKMYNELEYKGPGIFNFHGNWLRIPHYKEHLLFFHGEKNTELMKEIVSEIKKSYNLSSEVKNYPNINPNKNWGDIITKFILEHYSNKKLNDEDVFYFDKDNVVPHKNGKIIGVGSSMVFSKSDDYIWGTGCLDEYSTGVTPKKIYSVRGPMTRKALLGVGREVPEVYGDPALLMPRIYNPSIEKKYQYGVVPHYTDFTTSDGLLLINKLERLGIKIVNITAGIHEFIDELLECENILSSSLHGLIVADAYGIPNFRIKLSNLLLGGDFKFLDYYLSVKREHHKPIQVTTDIRLSDIQNLNFELGDISLTDKLLLNSPWNDEDCTFFQQNLKILFMAPHLSTGGMPAYLLNRIEILKKYHPEVEIYVIEYCQYSTIYNVQKDKIKELIPEDRYWTLNLLGNHSDENSLKIIDIIKENSIDIVHVDEILEGFDSFNQVSKNVLNAIFDNNRTWKVVETCHNIYFNPKNRHFSPDAYSFCTPYHKEIQFKDVDSYSEVFEFPIEKRFVTPEEKIEARTKLGLSQDKIHVINVGLWTRGKNQGEGIEIARLLQDEDIQFHFIGNQASNFEDYWKPFMVDKPSNVSIWGERNDVDDFMKAADIFLFNSIIECNPLVLREAASFGLKILSRNLPQYFDMFTPYITEIDGDVSKTSELIRELKYKGITRTYDITLNQSESLSNKHIEFYQKVKSLTIKEQPRLRNKIEIVQYYIDSPFIEIKGESSSSYTVQVYDEKDKLHYENIISSNSWVRMNRKYFTKWRTKIFEDNVLIWDKVLDYEGKRVYISFDSKSLGDSIAWIPYCLEFQNKHNCKVIVSTFWNKLFKDSYPELEFVNPGEVVNNITGMYKLGWFWDESREPEAPNTIPLQKAASNILGLEYNEIKPRINYEVSENPYNQKYVTIATNSTAGCKFWTKDGWQGLVDYLISKGYLVVNVSKENNELKNVMKIEDVSIENTMNVIHHSEFFIGLSSGLSWLAWGLGKQVVMISNFTTSDHEFNIDCIRITNPLVCNGCWNNPNFKFDKGDWNWCPVHKGTSRQFECHTSITPEMVINKIKHLL